MKKSDGEIKIGVVGLQQGKSHVSTIQKSEGFKLAGICDVEPDKLQAAAEDCSVDKSMLFSDYEKMLDEAQLDAVVIATPTHLHADMSIAAVSRGIHVLQEKPLATDMESCERIRDAVEKSNVVFQVGFEMRSSPLMRKIKEVIDSGQLGEIAILWVTMFRGPGNVTAWRYDRHIGGGNFFDCLIHEFNEMLDWAGVDFERAIAFGAPKGMVGPNADDSPDTVTACVEFQNGVRGSAAYSHLSQTTDNTHFGIVGTEGRIDVNPWLPEKAGSFWLYTEGGLFRNNVIVSGDKASTGHLGFSEQYVNFLATIRGESPNICDIHNALDTQRLMIAFDKSLAENRPIMRSEL